jgi:hypothetical protein
MRPCSMPSASLDEDTPVRARETSAPTNARSIATLAPAGAVCSVRRNRASDSLAREVSYHVRSPMR